MTLVELTPKAPLVSSQVLQELAGEAADGKTAAFATTPATDVGISPQTHALQVNR